MIKIINAKLIHETQGAYLIGVELVGAEPGQCWFPKSQAFFENNDTTKDFYAEQWVVDANSEELEGYILTGKNL